MTLNDNAYSLTPNSDCACGHVIRFVIAGILAVYMLIAVRRQIISRSGLRESTSASTLQVISLHISRQYTALNFARDICHITYGTPLIQYARRSIPLYTFPTIPSPPLPRRPQFVDLMIVMSLQRMQYLTKQQLSLCDVANYANCQSLESISLLCFNRIGLGVN